MFYAMNIIISNPSLITNHCNVISGCGLYLQCAMAWSLSNVPLLSSNASDDSLCESLPEQKFRNSCYLSHTEVSYVYYVTI